MLKALALHLTAQKEKFYTLSYRTGATRADSWIDIEEGSGTFLPYASLRRKFPGLTLTCLDGDPHILGKGGSFYGPSPRWCQREGTAGPHQRLFNFPVWGMLEKDHNGEPAGGDTQHCGQTRDHYLLPDRGGGPGDRCLRYPAPPAPCNSPLRGSAGDLLDHAGSQDVVTFTGSASTGLTAEKAIRVSCPEGKCTLYDGSRFVEQHRVGRGYRPGHARVGHLYKGNPEGDDGKGGSEVYGHPYAYLFRNPRLEAVRQAALSKKKAAWPKP